MSAERRKVLDMLAAGKITPEEAEQLLNRLAPSEKSDDTVESKDFEAANDGKNGKDPKKLRYLSALIPGKAGRQLSEQGIDLSHLGKLNGEALNEALAELDIDIQTEKGEKVRIFCE